MSQHDTDQEPAPHGEDAHGHEHEAAPASDPTPTPAPEGEHEHDAAAEDEVAFESDLTLEETQVPDHPVKRAITIDGRERTVWVYLAPEDIARRISENPDEFDEEELVDILREHYVAPDFSDLTVEKLDNMRLGLANKFLVAIAPELGLGESGN